MKNSSKLLVLILALQLGLPTQLGAMTATNTLASICGCGFGAAGGFLVGLVPFAISGGLITGAVFMGKKAKREIVLQENGYFHDCEQLEGKCVKYKCEPKEQLCDDACFPDSSNQMVAACDAYRADLSTRNWSEFGKIGMGIAGIVSGFLSLAIMVVTIGYGANRGATCVGEC